ncbi:MAG: tetratricopeptide repeat protein [Desulfobacula sp.]|jgi:tetratricopeptide (TPR) repeat protein|nr:tetratricopeptide repeat protein [Desulfobacula sp.]
MGFLNKLLGFIPKKTEKIYKKGMRFYNKLEYIEAVEYFEQVIAEEGLSKFLEYKLAIFYCGLAYRNLGGVEFAKNNNQQAVFNFKRALKYNPKHIDLNYFIGICLNNIGDFQGAMESFKIIYETEPWNIPNKLAMAIIFHNLEMWDNAEAIHRNLLEKNPNFADVHFHLGLSLMSQGKTSEAVESFKTALLINPNYVDAQLKLSLAQACMGRYEDAFTNLAAIIKKKPGYADVYYLIGIIKEECNETEEAIKYLQQAIHISPKFKNALVKLIICNCQLGKIDEAEKQIKEALEFYPDDTRFNSVKNALKIFDPSLKSLNDIPKEIKYILGNGLSIGEVSNEFHKGLDIMPNFSEIIAMFSSSKYAEKDPQLSDFLIRIITEQISKNPTYPDLYNSLGSQLLFSNKSIEAEEAFAKAVELNPGYMTARINLFKTLQKNGKHEEAYEHGKVLLSEDLPFPDVYYTLSEVLIDLKLYDDALINAQRVLKLRPSMKNANLLIARIHESQGNYDSAIKAINKCLKGDADPRLAADAKKMLGKLQKKV